MPSIIMSYRRTDSEAISGRIRDRLAARYGADSVFMDIDSIPFGVDFRQHINRVVKDSDLIIAVVGPEWAGFSRAGHTRIHDATDPVRLEIESGLQSGVPIVPVLIDGARMPAPDDLPESIRKFSYLNAARVDAGRDFHSDMDHFIRSVDRLAESQPASVQASEAIAHSMGIPVILGSAGLSESFATRYLIDHLLAIVVGFVIGWYLRSLSIKTTIAAAIAIACVLFIAWMFAFTYRMQKPPSLKIGLYAAAFLLCYEVWLLLAQFRSF
jgi:hypothetical protein